MRIGETAPARWLERHGALPVFWGAAALFLVLRLLLFTKYGLAQDEVLIISQVRTWDWGKIWHYYGFSGNGYFLQHLIFKVLTLGGALASEQYCRAICLLESFAGFALLWHLARRYSGVFTALLAVVLYALSPYQILYTLYVRFYALLMTVLLAEMWFYARALEENGRRTAKYLALALLMAALAYCTHQFSIFLQPCFALHFLLFCLCRRPARENLGWFAAGAAVAAALLAALLCSGFLMQKAGLTWGTGEAWLSAHWGRAAQRLQSVFWKQCLPVRGCTPVFIWLSLGLAVSARLLRRQKCWLEVFLALALALPYLFLSHLHFAHFFANRYFAFWFPVWILTWSVWLEFPAAFLANIRPLLGKELLWKGGLGLFLLAVLLMNFRWSEIENIRWLEYGNREAVHFLKAQAADRGLPLVLITEPDQGSHNYVLPQYYFGILGLEGECLDSLLEVMRRGAAERPLKPAMVAWAKSDDRLSAPEGYQSEMVGRYSLVYGGPCTNWQQVARATAEIIPRAKELVPPLDPAAPDILDIGTREAAPHLLAGFSHDEYASPENSCTWGTGTNLLIALNPVATNCCLLSIRARAVAPLTADFAINGLPLGSVRFATSFTNVLLRAENLPVGQPLRLEIATDRSLVPGHVARGVYESRPLSLCLDALALWPAPGDRELAAALSPLDLPARARPSEKLSLRFACANIGSGSWPREGATPVRLALRWQDAEGREVQDDRCWLPRGVLPGEALQIEAAVAAPAAPGRYRLRLGLVLENVRFFPDDQTFEIIVEK